MNKKAKPIDRVQNALIILLTVSALFLLSQTALFGSLSAKSPEQIFDRFFGAEISETADSSAALSNLAAPMQILFINDFSRFGQTSVTVRSSVFESISPLLSDALSSASSPVSVSEADFFSALQECGIYCDFTISLPLSILENALGIESQIKTDHFVRRALLFPDGQDVKLYLVDDTGLCTLYATTVAGRAVTELLDAQSDNGAYLCAQLPDEFVGLSPYTLIVSEQPQLYALSAVNPLAEADLSDLLRAAEFNPHTENRYTESSGTVVIREGDSSLRIAQDGTVTYQGSSAEPNSLYHVAAQGAKPTALETMRAIQAFASSFLQNKTGSAALCLSSMVSTAAGYRVYLDYAVNGTPIFFADGSHAAAFTVSGNTITAFSLHFRSYGLTDEAALILPLQQAFAIAQSSYENAEPRIYYVDSGTSIVFPGWIAE